MDNLKIIVFTSFIITNILYPQQRIVKDSSSIVQDSILTVQFNKAILLFNEHDDTVEALFEAKNEFISILKSNPNYAPAIAYLGLIALDNKDQEGADSLFTNALLIDSTCAEARIGKAQLYRQRMQ